MSIDIAYFPEPKLQFGDYFEYEDSKTGLAEHGPFGKCIDGLHRDQIFVGFVGISACVTEAKEWVEACGDFIQSDRVKTVTVPDLGGLYSEEEEEELSKSHLDKMRSRDFIGFNTNSKFDCRFVMNDRWIRELQLRKVELILKLDDKLERIKQLVNLFVEEIRQLAITPHGPHIIIIALSDDMVERADRERLYGNYYLDFRRLLKAQAMRWGIPIQILQSRTVTGKSSGKRELQDEATRAWNFCTAQYYKADGVPWRPLTLQDDTCFIGVSYYIANEEDKKLTMRASLAQAFDYLGQGLILRGDPFEWDVDKMGRTPHLKTDAARQLIAKTLKEYNRFTHLPAKRVVIHKTSVFWGDEHEEYNEIDGFQEGIADVYPDAQTNLVAIRQTGLRLFREGKYPPLRGTYLCIEQKHHFIYTMGYTPYLETYPGPYVPEPWQITQHIGDSSPKNLLKEILALTKMNVNNCSYADGRPITLSFSKMIGEVMKHIPPGEEAQPQYKYYM